MTVSGWKIDDPFSLFWIFFYPTLVAPTAHQRGVLVSMWAVPGSRQRGGITEHLGCEQQAVCGADWTASSAFFLRHSQQCNGRCHRVAYHPAFSMLKKRDCCTVPWLLQILQIIIFPVDINKTQTFYHTVALILRFRRHNVG